MGCAELLQTGPLVFTLSLSFPSDDVICDVALLCGRLPAAHYSTGAAVMTNNSLRESCVYKWEESWPQIF